MITLTLMQHEKHYTSRPVGATPSLCTAVPTYK